ncbi:FimV/HubP family polar landmark protein [Pseudomonas sp. LB3P31]
MSESLHVGLRCGARLLLVAGAVFYSALAPALGLGEITLHSALNQPLRADIALVDAAGLEEGDLSVNLATADEFSRAGVERVFFLNDLKFTPILRGNRSLIRVSSNKVVNEPFLNFLVQLNQPNGRVLREYTVLIDPPGAPGIVPVVDEPEAPARNSPFPKVKPAAATPLPGKKTATAPKPEPVAPAPVIDPAAEQLAASVLQNQQLQATVGELNTKLQAQDEQVAGYKKHVAELQTQLAELKQAPPAAPVAVAPAVAVVEEPESSNWLTMLGLLALAGLLLLGLFIRRQRQRQHQLADDLPQADPGPVSRADSEFDDQTAAQAPLATSDADQHEQTPSGDVLEGVGIYLAYGRFSEAAGLLREGLAKEPQRTDLAVQLLEVLGKQGDVAAYDAQENQLRDAGFDPQTLEDIRSRHPKMHSVAPVSAAPIVAAAITAAPAVIQGDEFQLNLDDLSMDANWDLISPFETAQPPAPAQEPAFASNLHVLPDVFEMPEESTQEESELQWSAEPDSQALDDDFLAEFGDPEPAMQLEPLSLEPDNAGKLEQAQTCIDDGDLDSAIELLNELLKDADEPLKQTARSLLAGIS